METITLGDLRTSVVYEASIDGQTSASSRHNVTALNTLINRYCREVRSIAADAGAPWYQKLGDITPIPAPTTGEDFIELPFPDGAIEIMGVDVTSRGGHLKFDSLDRAEWSQRRLLNCERNYPDSLRGWWCVKDMPDARDDTDVDPGTIAVFPTRLTGNYRVTYREQFSSMTEDNHVFAGIVPMFTWVINSCVMTIIKRDNNKKANYAAASAAVEKAEARILKASRRTQSGGAVVPKRVGGDPW